jgi:spore coat-associated protein N
VSGRHAVAGSGGPARRHLGLAAGATVLAALLGGGAAYAVLVDRDDAVTRISAGAVTLDWGAAGTDQTTVPVTGLRPGDQAVRIVDLTNTGTVAASEIALELGGSALGSTSDGLQLALDRCSVPWTGAPGTAVCPGTVTPVVPDRPAVGRVLLPGSPALAPGARDHLRLTLRLPESAPPTAQGLSGSVTLRVLGNQRPGEQR